MASELTLRYPRSYSETNKDTCYPGIQQDDGYAEYVMLKSEAVARVPDKLDVAEASPMLCAGATTFSG